MHASSRSARHAALTAAACGVLGGCGKSNPSAGGPPYTSLVVVLTSVDPGAGAAHFALEQRQFQYLDNLDDLNGQYIHIRRGGTLTVKSVNGSIIESDKFTGATSPDIRYTVKDGVVVPEDYPTLAMLSAYYQFETVFSQLEPKMGLPLATFAPTLPNSQMTVFFEPNISFVDSGLSGNVVTKLNAAFDPEQKDFILYQRSPLEHLPLSMNLQVIGHEFGHSIFQYSFYKDTTDDDNRWENEYALRGLNEGWADFSSYQYTGSADVLAGSIDIDHLTAERDFLASTFTYDDLDPSVSNAADSDGVRPICNGSFYCIGTLWARSMAGVEADMLAAGTSNKDFMAQLIAAEAKTQDTLNGLSSDILPASTVDERQAAKDASDDPDSIDDQYYAYDGQVAGAYLNALIQTAPAAWKSSMCSHFEANFSLSGFPTAARAVCN